MGYAVYQIGKRYGGYGVTAICEHPGCNKEIDRGMSYACGGEPCSELGCDRYFCSEHLYYTHFDEDGFVLKDDADDDEYDRSISTSVCERCRDKKEPFPYKPETKQRIDHINTHESRAEYRDGIKDGIVQ